MDGGQFAVYHQPETDLTTGEVGGAEALLRWTSPARGAISPSRFVPLAEAHRLIHALG